MIDALGMPRSLLVLGGTSEIGLAIARHWAERQPLRVVLAGRDPVATDLAADELRRLGSTVRSVQFDARDTDTHPQLVQEVFADGDIDVAVVAFGVLGDQERAWRDHRAAVEIAQVDYTAAVSCGVLLADAMQRQGHGLVVALSSVAGERVRRSNFAYGAAKAGMDAFYLGLGEALRDTGVRVLVVRPGFVHTRMSRGLRPAPLSVTAYEVARRVGVAVVGGRELVRVPAALGPVMFVLRHLPRPLFRRLPL
jgi:decaprenylphospho-beta-D-erythro-pentofuranosid-2-ulose 2-reductase